MDTLASMYEKLGNNAEERKDKFVKIVGLIIVGLIMLYLINNGIVTVSNFLSGGK